ncbi:MAG: hypothetical protein AABX11_05465 [Nanoarchaeota archaeon]
MIILHNERRLSGDLPTPLTIGDYENFFFRIHNHLHALNESSSTPDRDLYQDARDSIDYFHDELKLSKGLLIPQPDNQITNWQFLNLLCSGWKELGLAQRMQVPRDCTERLALENASVRALSRNDIIYLQLFRNQSTFSILRADLRLLNQSLRQVMIDNGKIRL